MDIRDLLTGGRHGYMSNRGAPPGGGMAKGGGPMPNPQGPPAPPAPGGEGGGGGLPVGLAADVANRNRMMADKEKYRGDWSAGDWERGLRNALQVGTRHGGSPGEWEYDIGGEWVNQETYDDPMWRRNIFDPWQQGIRDEWTGNREAADKWNQQHAGDESPYGTMDERPMGRYGRSRGIGKGGGGGGGRYDPAMIAQLIGG